MNCIDAIEGSLRCIIDRFHHMFVEERLDDTEYIRNVKTLIQGTYAFIEENQEIITEQKIVQHVLYEYAKKIWLNHLLQSKKKRSAEDVDYYEYYYDYIYEHGSYPP